MGDRKLLLKARSIYERSIPETRSTCIYTCVCLCAIFGGDKSLVKNEPKLLTALSSLNFQFESPFKKSCQFPQNPKQMYTGRYM